MSFEGDYPHDYYRRKVSEIRIENDKLKEDIKDLESSVNYYRKRLSEVENNNLKIWIAR